MGVQQAIEQAGAHVLYLPPYSPDFNPIEMLWSKLGFAEKVSALNNYALVYCFDGEMVLSFA